MTLKKNNIAQRAASPTYGDDVKSISLHLRTTNIKVHMTRSRLLIINILPLLHYHGSLLTDIYGSARLP